MFTVGWVTGSQWPVVRTAPLQSEPDDVKFPVHVMRQLPNTSASAPDRAASTKVTRSRAVEAFMAMDSTGRRQKMRKSQVIMMTHYKLILFEFISIEGSN